MLRIMRFACADYLSDHIYR
ncbi:MAG TPA: hypothetical protein DHW71_13440 [Gammaproteobacteria bacterium]|nr:hypothetical protein [Gammaproteobacteria bacterium]HBF08682.1 hypothetical protein [Gammaproteobacteria bacterium]HCK93993.1 hypothetical protein [Gammaproteobacteria bacterium]